MRRREFLASGTLVGAAGGLSSAATARLPRRRLATGSVATPDGTRLFLRDWGDGPALLFLHSWALDSRMWRQQFVTLGAAGRRCIAFDRRGHGQSGAPATGYDLDTLADDLAAVIHALDLRRVTLVGHSMGGCEIIRYLARHGSARIDRVALLAPTTPFLTRTDDNPLGVPPAYLAAVRAEWLADFPKWVADNRGPFFTADTSPATMDWLADMMAGAWLPAALACNIAVTATDLRPDLARVDRPTLVIHGDRDASAPLDMTGRPTAAGIRGARLIVYEGAPHGLFVTHAARLHADLLQITGG